MLSHVTSLIMRGPVDSFLLIRGPELRDQLVMLLYGVVLLDSQLFQMIEMVSGEVFEFKMPAMTQLIAMMVPFSVVLLF